ncbi:hypothetical protein BJ742DRAFT_822245 [Cladochytrium replicatum]|nr:hypothetical protein BJ742DRAFT_822245 [Cladochytrium replicatum]
MRPVQCIKQQELAQLRSTLVISSVSHCVVELVQNSIDAGATSIEVAVQKNGNSLSVSDNGCGINPQCLKMVGQRNASSKHSENENFYGSRGEALASIGEVARLEITTRGSSVQAFTIIIKGSESLFYGPSKSNRKPGTTVLVTDLFYKYPVRRKQLLSKDNLHAITRALECIALISPGVSLSLVDPERNLRLLSVKRVETAVSIFRQLFGLPLSQGFEYVSFTDEDSTIDVSGHISTVPHPTKQHQYLYANRHHLAPCDLHALINRLFAESSFAQGLIDGSPQKGLQRKVKADRFPLFILNIRFNPKYFRCDLDSSSSAVAFHDRDTVIQVLEQLIQSFLEEHMFVSKQKCVRKRKRDEFDSEIWLCGTGEDEPAGNHTMLPAVRSSCSYINPSVKLPAVEKSMSARLWAEDALKQWDNPVFKAAPRNVHAAKPSTSGAASSRLVYNSSAFQGFAETPQCITKDDLRTFEVIGQVDRQFIACKYSASHTSTNSNNTAIVLVDQHAADERIRLEELLANFLNANSESAVETVILKPPMRFPISASEAVVFERQSAVMRKWGFRLIITRSGHLSPGKDESRAGTTADLSTVPRLVVDRCVLDKDLTIDLIRQHSFWLDEHGTEERRRVMPTGLVDLLNSKACRSAIMFGDELSPEECAQIIEKLKCTNFPFQCAHGRPSMVPLLKLPQRAGKPQWAIVSCLACSKTSTIKT